jgi:hypothetical protein
MSRQYLDLARIYGAVDQSRANEAQLENNRLQNERYMRQSTREDAELARQEGIRGIYKGAIEMGEDGSPKLNEKRLITELYGMAPEQALSVQEGFTKRDSEAAKAKRENQKFEIENKSATVKYLKDKLATVRDDAGFQAFKQEAMELGAQDLVSSAPPQFDPQWQQSQMVNADKFLERNTPKYERVDLGGKIQVVDVNPVTNPKFASMQLNKTQTPDSLASNAISIRGQNMTAARADEANRLKSEENAIKRNEKTPENSTTIRKEFDQLPEVKNYKQALPAYKAIEDAATRNTTASDINIVYGLAKLYDPNSVVREGEYATVANSPNIPEKLKGQIQYITGGGRLTPETKKQIIAEARGRMRSFEDEYSNTRKGYEDIAARSNADPTLVFPGKFQSAIKQDAAKPTNAPKKGTVEGGYIFIGGDPSDPKSWKKK